MALFGLLGGKKTSVGLDIGSGIIKLVAIDHSGSEPELAKVATTEVAADAIVEGEVMDPGIHDLAFDDRVGGHLCGGDLREFGLAPGMVYRDELDDAGADIQADRGLLAAEQPEQGHSFPRMREEDGARANYSMPRPLSCQVSNLLEA